MSLIKKEQIKYGSDHNRSVIKSSSQKFQLNVSIPKDKIEEEINILKKELMKEAEEYRNQLNQEKELLLKTQKELAEKEKDLDDEKKDFFSDIDATKEKIKKEAYESGYEEGQKKGYSDGSIKGEADGRKDHDKARKAYEDALYGLMDKFKELDDYKKEILVNTEPYLISLLDVIIKKLLSRSIEIDKNIMVEVVKEALLPVTSGHDLTIKVNPENVGHLEDNKSKLMSEFMSVKDCKIVGDPNVSQGGCLIEANFGIIDSRIESKMQSIKDLICSIKDCDVKDAPVSILPDKEKDSSLEPEKSLTDDLFGDKDDILSFDESLDDSTFDFLTEDD